MVSVALNDLSLSLISLGTSQAIPALIGFQTQAAAASQFIRDPNPSLPTISTRRTSVLGAAPFRVSPESSGLLIALPEGSDLPDVARLVLPQAGKIFAEENNIHVRRVLFNLQHWMRPPEISDETSQWLQYLVEEYQVAIVLQWRDLSGPRISEFNPRPAPTIRDLWDGVQEVLRLVRETANRRVLIGVYGWPNSGKSYFIGKVREVLSGEGISSSKMGSAPNRFLFNWLAQEPDYFPPVMLFHCGWIRGNNRKSWSQMRSNEGPNVLAEEVLGRTLDANIGIYNPNMRRAPTGEYDFIIQNPDSRSK